MSTRDLVTTLLPGGRAAVSLALTLLACGATLACGTRQPAPQSATSVDLLAALEAAEVSLGAVEAIVAPIGPAAEANRILTEEMDDSLDARWWSDEPGAGALTSRLDRIEGESALVLSPSDRPIARLLPSSPTDIYRVRVRWRAEGSSAGTLVVRGLLDAPRRFADPERVRSFVLREGRKIASATSRLTLGPGSGWQEGELVVGHDVGRRSLLLRLLASEGSLQIDRLEVRRLTPLEAYVQLAPAEPDRSPLFRRLQLPFETFDGLLLPAGARVTWDVAVPSARPRLDTQVRVLGGPASSTEVVLRVDGKERSRRAGDPRTGQEGDPWRVPLDDDAGRRVALELSIDGPEGSVAILTAPRLLGSGDPRPAVVLVSLDTLRADHLGAYGDDRPLSPHIDRLAEEGTLFERVVSPASYTLPTHATILTGQHPLVHGVRRRGHRIDPARSETLARRLRREGYATAAFTGGGYVSPVFGFSQGFEQYSTRDPGVSRHLLAAERRGLAGNEVGVNRSRMERVLEWMRRYEDQPYVLFVHTYLVHGYFPQQRYLDLVDPDSDIDLDDLRITALWERAKAGDAQATEDLRVLYAATVAQADDLVIGPLLEAVDRRAAEGGETIVALLSDHGEQFLEHQELGHGGPLWNEVVDVPWILRGPGIERGVRRSDPVGLVDVTPTLLALLGLSPDPSQTGLARLGPGTESSLTDLLLHHEPEPHLRWDGLVTPHWKLLRTEQGESVDWLLFDLDTDPGETRDRSETDPEVLADMKARLQERTRRILAAAPAGETAGEGEEDELPESVLEELRALGYVDG